jgi:hypothetical protein
MAKRIGLARNERTSEGIPRLALESSETLSSRR